MKQPAVSQSRAKPAGKMSAPAGAGAACRMYRKKTDTGTDIRYPLGYCLILAAAGKKKFSGQECLIVVFVLKGILIIVVIVAVSASGQDRKDQREHC